MFDDHVEVLLGLALLQQRLRRLAESPDLGGWPREDLEALRWQADAFAGRLFMAASPAVRLAYAERLRQLRGDGPRQAS